MTKHIDELEKLFKGNGLFESVEQRKTCEIFAQQRYKTIGRNKKNDILMFYKHSSGTCTKVIIYVDGKWDIIKNGGNDEPRRNTKNMPCNCKN